MNIINAVRDYVFRITDSVEGMKALMLDRDTSAIVGMVCGKSQISQKEVFLFELIETEHRDTLPHLKAICILRPTPENISLLCRELSSEVKYGQYHIFFTNIVRDMDIQRLAEADQSSVVEQVQEFYADFFALDSDTFSFNFDPIISNTRDEEALIVDRCCAGLSAVLLALKKKPFVRFQKASHMCQLVSQEIARRMVDPTLNQLYGTNRPDQPVLLILDRRNDPVTPLLHQWTYQAMVHELLGISNNIVHLTREQSSQVGKQGEELVLAPEFDPFYARQMYNNFGEFCEAFGAMKNEYREKDRVVQDIKQGQSLEKLKDFIETDFGDYRKFTAQFAAHAKLLDCLNQLVTQRKLMEVSEFEQDLAVKNDHSTHLQQLNDILDNSKYSTHDKMKLVLLYALRYESNANNQIPQLTQRLLNVGVPSEQIKLIGSVLKYAGASARVGDLFSNKNLWATSKSFIKSWQGVEHNLLAHKPLLNEIIEELVSGRISPIDYPCLGAAPREGRVTDVIIFMVGGITYEEARCVHEINSARQGVRVILGGTTVHNSTSFLRELAKLQ